MSEEWLNKRELAARLKVSSRTIERLGLPSMRVGGQNRYLEYEVREFLRARERGRLAEVIPLRRDQGKTAA